MKKAVISGSLELTLDDEDKNINFEWTEREVTRLLRACLADVAGRLESQFGAKLRASHTTLVREPEESELLPSRQDFVEKQSLPTRDNSEYFGQWRSDSEH